jgi:hypothetical protein
VTLAQTWLRQAFGAAGASLLVPLAALAAAGVLAAGSGLGGLSELGQIGSGPELPGAQVSADSSAIAEADIVGADLTAGSGAGAGTGPGFTGSDGALGTAPGEPGLVPSPLLDVPSAPGGGGTVPGGPVTQPGQPQSNPAPATGPGQAPPETVREIQTLGPEPIQSVTQELIDLLVGPPPR